MCDDDPREDWEVEQAEQEENDMEDTWAQVDADPEPGYD